MIKVCQAENKAGHPSFFIEKQEMATKAIFRRFKRFFAFLKQSQAYIK